MSKVSSKRSYSNMWNYHMDYDFDGSEDENSQHTNESDDESDANNEIEIDRKESDAQDNINKWIDELALLEEGKHPEYLNRLQQIENTLTERKYRNHVLYEFRKEEIEEEYKKEIETSEKDLIQERQNIMDRLLTELHEKKRLLESEKNNVDLTISGDVLELKPTVTRKLRRRGANDSGIGGVDQLGCGLGGGVGGNSGLGGLFDSLAGGTVGVLGSLNTSGGLEGLRGVGGGGVGGMGSSGLLLTPGVGGVLSGIGGSGVDRSAKKRKQMPPANFSQINPLLNETDIYADLTKIQRACGKPTSRKLAGVCGGVYSGPTGGGEAGSEERTSRSVWIDDGRLYYDHKCFQQGMEIMVDTRDGPSQKYSGKIVTVGMQDVSVRRSSDMGVFKITIHQLRNGKYALYKRS